MLVLPVLILSAVAASAPPATYTVECRFSNPAYSGHCTVEERVPAERGPRQACGVILDCLNDHRCTTKTYCNATEVRGGWQLVSSQAKDEVPPR